MGDPSIANAVTGLGSAVAAAGTLGTACFGIVEALKWTPIGTAGFSQIRKYLDKELMEALRVAYGASYEKLLRAQYRQDSTTQAAIAKALRQGVRLGLTPTNAKAIAANLGTVDGASLQAAITKVASGADQLDAEARGAIGRFESAVDARIDSALSNAQDIYLGAVRCSAAALAIVIAQIAEWTLQGGWTSSGIAQGLVIGLIAVPIAPIANDLVGALQALTKSLKTP